MRDTPGMTARQAIGVILMDHDVEAWFATDIIAALDAAGYAIVPKEPTKAMIEAGRGGVCLYHPDDFNSAEAAEESYRAMLAASQQKDG